MMKVCISGLGRAGSQIARYLLAGDQAKPVSAICSPGSVKAGRDLGEVVGCRSAGIQVYPSDRIESCVFNTRPDLVLDFSTPSAALANAEAFFSLNVRVVMGTTGFSKAEEAELYALADRYGAGLIYAPNITRGVSTLMFLTELASRILNGYDVEIIEMHHNRKADIPSGTAAKLADRLRETSPPGEKLEVPIASVRAGGIVGCHKVMLVGKNDMVEISHQSFSRDAFAEGALYAAEFIQDKTGIYEMKDAMNLDGILADYLNRSAENPPRRFALV
ncbi:4-hydroxy-tetrahydrodipicolinate reductase [Caproiciproducens sp. NJN-50]|uniref:4-hydroxy-tetrahydrodipicolinate reductase n=1 Tax=Caproiciproducens sp. NJN-50 TaxID=2507162 RepID=UPI0013E8D339|nr:4-hydroxy-tetrahydrodipicolinate reductase [Caproiciproducens sp. NJN-50]